MTKLDVAAAKAARKGNSFQTNEAFEDTLQEGMVKRQEIDARSAAAHAKGNEEFYELRKNWSAAILAWITALIVFHICLTLMVGEKILDFTDYEWFITIVTVETFLQVIGMGLIAVKFLFSDNSKKKGGSKPKPRKEPH